MIGVFVCYRYDDRGLCIVIVMMIGVLVLLES